MILFCNIVCAYVYKICEGKFGGCDNRSFSWLCEKVKDSSIPGPRFSFSPQIPTGHLLSRVVVVEWIKNNQCSKSVLKNVVYGKIFIVRVTLNLATVWSFQMSHNHFHCRLELHWNVFLIFNLKESLSFLSFSCFVFASLWLTLRCIANGRVI